MSGEQFRSCAEASIPIPEALLRNAAKDLGSLLSSKDSDHALLSRLTQALLATAHVPDLATPHRVAACNVLCGTLEQCMNSSNEDVRHLAIARPVRHKLFEIYVDCYDNGKGKAMKQVLGTLIKLLSKSCAEASRSEPVDVICVKCFDIAFRVRDRTKTKPALYALTLFLSRKLLSTVDMLKLYNGFTGITIKHGSSDDTESPLRKSESADLLLSALLSWMPVGDIAPAAGQLLAALLSDKSHESRRGSSDCELPIWVKPLVDGIASRPDELQAYRHHAFPALFQNRIHDFKSFLNHLGLERHLGLHTEPDSAAHHGRSLHPSVLERSILFSALQAGKASGLVREYTPKQGLSEVLVRDDVVFIPDNVLGELCAQASPDARLAGLALLVSSASATRPLTTSTLAYLQEHLPHMFADADPNFRGEVHSLFQALINRFRSILAVLARQKAKMANGNSPLTFKHDAARTNDVHTQVQAAEVFREHSSFLEWTLVFLKSELVPSASYQRHISALKALSIVLKSGLDTNVELSHLARSARGEVRWPLHLQVIDSPTRRALLDLLLDPFDDVRQTSLEILFVAQSSQPAGSPKVDPVAPVMKLSGTLDRARDMMLRSGRLDQADGVARLYSLAVHEDFSTSSKTPPWDTVDDLTTRIEAALETAKHDIATAVRDHPLHGLFTALRYVLEQLFQHPNVVQTERQRCAATLDRICEALSATWQRVRDLLCNDAPEGFMPEDMDEEDSLTSKDVLSYAWRGLKESSSLLRALISPECFSVLGEKDYNRRLSKLGDLCFVQLAELRHRGAFSTVAQTFALLSRQCAVSKDSGCRSLTLKWYNQTLHFIQQKGQAITRRSAGLPQIIVGLIASDDSGTLYEQAMSDLTAMSEAEPVVEDNEAVDLPQVHALNSIRAIFITSRLASRSENSIVQAMSLAARCLASGLWAIRNCGLMLFRSLIDRMLGSNESADDFFETSSGNLSRLSYEKHPGLLELIIRLLRSSSATNPDEEANAGLSAEAIFPVLDLLRRAPPPESARLEVYKLIDVACADQSWHVRDMAARTVAALTSSEHVVEQVTQLSSTPFTSRNAIHGHLLAIKHMLKTFLTTSEKEVQLGDADLLPTETAPRTNVMLKLLASDSALCQRCVHQDMDDTLACAYLDILNLLGTCLTRNVREDKMSCDVFVATVRHTRSALLTRAQHQRGAAILRVAIFKASCLAALLSDSTSIIDVLTYFDDQDVSGMIEVLEGIQVPLTGAHAEALLNLLLSILSSSKPSQTRLRSSILNNVVHILVDMPLTEIVKHEAIVQSLSRMQIATTISDCKAPSDMYSRLGIWGYVLASQHICDGKFTLNTMQDLQTWLRLCSASLDENNEFPLRNAAAVSLHGITLAQNGVHSLPESLQVDFYVCVYQALTDDDEDIRTLAARTVVRAVTGVNDVSGSNEVVPQMAVQKLSTYLVEHFQESSRIFEVACERLLGQSVAKPTLIAASDLLQHALKVDTILFGEEKQNLYIDEAKEAYIFSRILLSLKPAPSCSKLIEQINIWTFEGLSCMVAKARAEVDGALGWATTRDAFTLGIRVIMAAEVSCHWLAEMHLKAERAHLLQILKELAEISSAADLPGTWRHHIERVQATNVDEGNRGSPQALQETDLES